MQKKPRHMRIILDGEDYIQAVLAHKRKEFIEATGTVENKGKGSMPMLTDLLKIKFSQPENI